MNPRRARAADVAARAGVSTTAVSFVFSGKDSGNIAPATRERILAAGRELGYQPNRLAQSLRSSRTQAIGLVTDGIASSPFAGRLLAAAGQRAAEQGHVVITFDTHFRDERAQAAVDELTSRRVDSLVYATMGLRRITSAPETTLPLVLANCFQEPDLLPTAIPDELRVGRDAADLLTSRGHRRIVMLGGPPERKTAHGMIGNVAGPMRAKGFRAGLRAAGIVREAGEVRQSGWDISDGYITALTILTDERGALRPARQRPTAVFAVNDRVATGALLAAARLGLDIPSELSIVSIDDQEALADQLVPALTTFRLPHAAMGEWAIDAALSLIGGRAGSRGAGSRETGSRSTTALEAFEGSQAAGPGEVPVRVLLPCEIVERETVAAPRAD